MVFLSSEQSLRQVLDLCQVSFRCLTVLVHSFIHSYITVVRHLPRSLLAWVVNDSASVCKMQTLTRTRTFFLDHCVDLV